ncbi:recombination protein NinB [Bradyrhizobium sp. 2S1]|uniref:recombination protein NinB n=1 Tax=Bradyrhizobium sp. 2S1 TaxID=1404429 RepID=UPI00140BE695|nr:recombination protein NinB [Bradyrhizobium sp. 2S1]MCK7669099.1 recombination protein NinB [Bradyrhizobium sp. 2S1]MCK7671505.1 recombination protein NinB [Bradyrhizobium sp. 2S1]
MSGIVIANEEDRIFLCRMVMDAKPGTLIEMHVDLASEAQRKKMWAMLGEVSKQVPHVDMNGNTKFYAPEQWKLLMMHACGQEVEMMPSLDGSTFLPYEGRSSKMKAVDMGELLAFIEAWGVQNGVEFSR